jgi:hypothetical protein
LTVAEEQIALRFVNIEDLLGKSKWEETIEGCLKIIDIALTSKYNTLFHLLPPDSQLKIVKELTDKHKVFADLMFGDKIRIFRENEILKYDSSVSQNTIGN